MILTTEQKEELSVVINACMAMGMVHIVFAEGRFSALNENRTCAVIGAQKSLGMNEKTLVLSRIKEIKERLNSTEGGTVELQFNGVGNAVRAINMKKGRTSVSYQCGFQSDTARLLKTIKDTPMWQLELSNTDVSEVLNAIKMMRPTVIGFSVDYKGSVKIKVKDEVEDCMVIDLENNALGSVGDETDDFDNVFNADMANRVLKFCQPKPSASVQVCLGERGTLSFHTNLLSVYQFADMNSKND